ncbi:MAG: hypothetical protein U9O83_02810 [Campylobacterota bacterium]|nr:hypothetical protein [Campylobacterota bacterium]
MSIFFLLKYSKIRPTPPLATCLDKSNILVSNLVVLSITLGYGVAVLALFRAFTGDELKLEVITLSLLVLFLGAATYLYLCKKNRVVDKFS